MRRLNLVSTIASSGTREKVLSVMLALALLLPGLAADAARPSIASASPDTISVSGRVFQHTPDGSVVSFAGVTVQLIGGQQCPVSGKPLTETTTNADGFFSLTDQGNDAAYEVVVVPPAGWESRSPKAGSGGTVVNANELCYQIVAGGPVQFRGAQFDLYPSRTTLTLDKEVAVPRESLIATGGGYHCPPNAPIRFLWDNQIEMGQTSTDPFTKTLTIPPNATPGSHGIVAVCRDGGTARATLRVNPGPPPPPARFTFPSGKLFAGGPIRFSAITDPSIVRYDWDFDNGVAFGHGAEIDHAWFGYGNHTVQLTTYDKYGVGTVFNTPIYLFPYYAAFTTDVVSGNPPLTVHFTNTSSGAFAGYHWDFGDGTSSTAINPVHTYTVPGYYSVVLTEFGVTHASDVVSTPHRISANPRSFDLSIFLVQPVQESFGWTPMIEGKRTMVRVWATYPDTPDAVPNLTNLRLDLVATDANSGTPRSGTPALIQQSSFLGWFFVTFHVIQYDYEIPSDWLYGDINLTATVNGDHGVPETNFSNNNKTVSVHFNPSRGVDLLAVPLRNANRITVQYNDIWSLLSAFNERYPIPENGVRMWQLTGDVGMDSSDDDLAHMPDQINNLVPRLRPVVDGERAVGLLGRGTTDTFGGCHAQGISYITAPGVQIVDEVPVGGGICSEQTLAHELGHSFSLKHTPEVGGCCAYSYPSEYPSADGHLDYTAYDMVNHQEQDSATHYDVMSYSGCCNNQWFSALNYNRMVDWFFSPGATLEAASVDSAPAEYLDVGGTIFLNAAGQLLYHHSPILAARMGGEQATLDPAFNELRPSGGREDSPGSGDYSLTLLDEGGLPIFTRHFNMTVFNEALPNLPQGFYQILPWSIYARQIVLKHGDVTLATRSITVNPPTVNVTRPAAGASYASGQPVVVAWQASDSQNLPLSYEVDFTPDGGSTWQPVSAVISQTQLMLNSRNLPACTRCEFRVKASNGGRSGEGMSAEFSVGRTPPTARIIAPYANQRFVVGQPVRLTGIGTDLTDGQLGDAALSWTDNVAGAIGTGRTLMVTNLGVGRHTLTLTVHNAGGQTATAQVTIQVVPTTQRYRNFIPLDAKHAR